MNKDLNPETLGLLGGIVVIALAAVGFGYYFVTSAAAPAVEVPATQYPTSVLSSEFGSNGVFVKTRSLTAPSGGTVPAATPVAVGSGELGKSDLGSIE